MDQSWLTPQIDVDGLSPDEAFAVLGDETRLKIIRELWRAGAFREYDDIHADATTLPFSELRRRVEIDDKGHFNYHLSKLTPDFVRKNDTGYRLSGAGKKIARTVIAISGEQDPIVFDEQGVDCPVCDAPVTAKYEDQWLRFSCTECDGLFGDAAPEGAILNAAFPAGGLSDRTEEDALATGVYRCMLDIAYLMQGLCRVCASPITASMSTCEKHELDGMESCDTCGTPFRVWVDHRCDTCRFAKRLPLELCVMGLAPVIGFLYERGINALAPSLHESVDAIRTQFRTTFTSDPLRATVTIADETEELRVTLNDEMVPIDISRKSQ